jgi:hypothetical protein
MNERACFGIAILRLGDRARETALIYQALERIEEA